MESNVAISWFNNGSFSLSFFRILFAYFVKMFLKIRDWQYSITVVSLLTDSIRIEQSNDIANKTFIVSNTEMSNKTKKKWVSYGFTFIKNVRYIWHRILFWNFYSQCWRKNVSFIFFPLSSFSNFNFFWFFHCLWCMRNDVYIFLIHFLFLFIVFHACLGNQFYMLHAMATEESFMIFIFIFIIYTIVFQMTLRVYYTNPL